MKRIDDLELYELFVAAYPEKFKEESGKDIWDEVMEFAEENFDIQALSDLLARVVYLTSPIQSQLSGKFYHCIGKIDDQGCMETVIKREFIRKPAEPENIKFNSKGFES